MGRWGIFPLYTVALLLLVVSIMFKAIFSQKLKKNFFFERERASKHANKMQGRGEGERES